MTHPAPASRVRSRAVRSTVTTLATLVAPLAACDLSPGVGPAQIGRCENADSDPATDVSFSRQVQPMLLRETGGCLPCHDSARENAIGVTLGGLDLTTYENLKRGGVRSGASIVLSQRPCQSVIFQKLSAGPPFGSRMPLNGPPFLSDPELGLIHDWIAEGAEDN